MSIKLLLILLIIFSILFVIYLQKKKKNEVLSFISTSLATLLGVLLAVSLSNYQQTIKEQNDTIKILESAEHTLNLNLAICNGYISYQESIYADSLNVDTKKIIKNFFIKSPLPYPEIFEDIILNKDVSKNISKLVLTQIYSGLINLKSANKTGSYESFLDEQEYLLEFINLELKYLNEEISTTELEKKIDNIIKKKISKKSKKQ